MVLSGGDNQALSLIDDIVKTMNLAAYSANGHNILSRHGPAFTGSLGWCYQFTHSGDQFVDSFGSERGLAIVWAHPGIDVRHAD
jgi:hypothetical protein